MTKITIPIAGIQPLTTIDYPGNLASVLFVRGCKWKCSYCHNKSICDYDYKPLISSDKIHKFLRDRRDFVDGIVISGGEPTQYKKLWELFDIIYGYEYKIVLHTNGAFPDYILDMLHGRYLDYTAIDLKTLPSKYEKLTGDPNAWRKVSDSINEVNRWMGSAYELRTTVTADMVDDIYDIAMIAYSFGCENYYIQRASDDVIIPEWVIDKCKETFVKFKVR